MDARQLAQVQRASPQTCQTLMARDGCILRPLIFSHHLQRQSSTSNIGSVDEPIDVKVMDTLEQIVVLGKAGDGIELADIDLLIIDVKEVNGTVLTNSVKLNLEATGVGKLAGRSVEGGCGLDELAPTAEELALVGITAGNALDQLDAARVLPILEPLDRLALTCSPEPNGVIDGGLGVVKDELASGIGKIDKVAPRCRLVGLTCSGGRGRHDLSRSWLLCINGRDGTWATACGSAEILKIIWRPSSHRRRLELDTVGKIITHIVGRCRGLLVGSDHH